MSLISDLLALQERDSYIRDLELKIRNLPLRRKQEEEPVTRLLSEIASESDAMNARMNRSANLSAEIEEIEANIKLRETQRQTMATEREITSATREIESNRSDVVKRRRMVAELASDVEHHKAVIARKTANLEIARASIADKVTEINKMIELCEAELQEAKAGRGVLLEALNKPEATKFLNYYERLSKRYWPVVEVVDADGITSCPGCHMALTASKLQEAKRNAMLSESDPSAMQLVTCDYCGRLIFKIK